jgi:hypothetical protein
MEVLMRSFGVRSGVRARLLLAATLGLALALPVALPAMAQQASVAPAPAFADAEAEGAALATRFMEILGLPDAEKAAELETFLGDAFQLVRANGTWADKAAYLADPATVHEFRIENVVTTQHEDLAVVSYVLETTETIDGVESTNHAPRLSVFHWDGAGWRLVAHSNFGVVEPPASEPSPAPAG